MFISSSGEAIGSGSGLLDGLAGIKLEPPLGSRLDPSFFGLTGYLDIVGLAIGFLTALGPDFGY